MSKFSEVLKHYTELHDFIRVSVPNAVRMHMCHKFYSMSPSTDPEVIWRSKGGKGRCGYAVDIEEAMKNGFVFTEYQ